LPKSRRRTAVAVADLIGEFAGGKTCLLHETAKPNAFSISLSVAAVRRINPRNEQNPKENGTFGTLLP
jgi:hypothetical protein